MARSVLLLYAVAHSLLQGVTAQSTPVLGSSSLSCTSPPPTVTITVQPEEVDVYVSQPTVLSNLCHDGSTVSILQAPTVYTTTCYNTVSRGTGQPSMTRSTPQGDDSGGQSSTGATASTTTRQLPTTTSLSLPTTFLTPTPATTYTPVSPPATTRAPATNLVTTTDANGNVVTTTVSEPTLRLGQGLPAGLLTAIPSNSPVLLGYAFVEFVPAKLRRRQSKGEVAAGFVSSEGTDNACSQSTRFYLEDGQLKSNAGTIGKNEEEAFAELVPSTEDLAITSTFYFNDGILGFVATDFGPATFYQCGGVVLYAGFPYPPYSNCSTVQIGAVAGQLCPLDLTSSTDSATSTTQLTTASSAGTSSPTGSAQTTSPTASSTSDNAAVTSASSPSGTASTSFASTSTTSTSVASTTATLSTSSRPGNPLTRTTSGTPSQSTVTSTGSGSQSTTTSSSAGDLTGVLTSATPQASVNTSVSVPIGVSTSLPIGVSTTTVSVTPLNTSSLPVGVSTGSLPLTTSSLSSTTTTTTRSSSPTTRQNTTIGSSATSLPTSSTTTPTSTSSAGNTFSDVPSPLRTLSADFDGWRYAGCGTDNSKRVLSLHATVLDGAKISEQTCLPYCASNNYTIAGLENADQCWCGNRVRNTTLVADSKCNIPCRGNSTQNCGGGDQAYISLYTHYFNISQLTDTDSLSDNTVTDRFGYVGCANDTIDDKKYPRALKYTAYDDTTPNAKTYANTTSCLSACYNAGYQLAATEFSYQCFCGNTILNSTLVADSDCNSPCAQNSSQKCGGSARMSLYSYNKLPIALFNTSVTGVSL